MGGFLLVPTLREPRAIRAHRIRMLRLQWESGDGVATPRFLLLLPPLVFRGCVRLESNGGISTLVSSYVCRIVEMMKLVVKGVGFSITPSLRRSVDAKLVGSVERLLGRHPAYDAATLELELIHGTHHHRKGKVWEAVVNLRLPSERFWKRIAAEDIHAAIDELESVLKRELTRYKERSRSRFMRGARQAKKDIHFSRSARLYRKGRIRQEGA